MPLDPGMFTNPDPDLNRPAVAVHNPARQGYIPAALEKCHSPFPTESLHQQRSEDCVLAKCLIGAVLKASPGQNTPERDPRGVREIPPLSLTEL